MHDVRMRRGRRIVVIHEHVRESMIRKDLVDYKSYRLDRRIMMIVFTRFFQRGEFVFYYLRQYRFIAFGTLDMNLIFDGIHDHGNQLKEVRFQRKFICNVGFTRHYND